MARRQQRLQLTLIVLSTMCFAWGQSSVCSISSNLVVDVGDTCTIQAGTHTGQLDSVHIAGTVIIESTSNAYVTITASSVEITDTGHISADRQGYAARQGTGAGNTAGSGGSYGGRGGRPASGFLSGGSGYGNFIRPLASGSGGGGSNGGPGGGVIYIIGNNTVKIDGVLSANGGDASGSSSGGGSGGSVFVWTADLSGNGGLISAVGGRGGTNGGGGSGGRISLHYNDYDFTGRMFAHGGRPDGDVDEYQTASSMYASSVKPGYDADKGRLENGNTVWRPLTSQTGSFIRITFEIPLYITSVSTRGCKGNKCYQGDENTQEWVKKYYVKIDDGSGFVEYKPFGNTRTIFDGNVDGTNEKRNDFDFPVLAKSIQVHPTEWQGQISLAVGFYGYTNDDVGNTPDTDCNVVNDAESGGPGTIYTLEGAQKRLRISNMGNKPKIPVTADCTKYRYAESGAVAWIPADEVDEYTLHELTLENGGQVVFNHNAIVSNINGDETSIVHIAEGIQFHLEESSVTTSALYLYDDAALELVGNICHIKRSLVAWGEIITDHSDWLTFGGFLQSKMILYPKLYNNELHLNAFTIKEDAEVILVESDEPDICGYSLHIDGGFAELQIEERGKIKVSCPSTFVGGNFQMGLNSEAVIRVDSMLRFDEINIAGSLSITNKAIFSGKLEYSKMLQFNILEGGAIYLDTNNQPLVVNGTENADITWSSLYAGDVVIAGIFHPKLLKNNDGDLSGWEILIVNASGVFNFTTAGKFQVDDIDVAGKIIVQNPIWMESRADNVKRVNSITIEETGEIRLDETGRITGAWSYESTLLVKQLVNKGHMFGGLISVNSTDVHGWDYLVVDGAAAVLEFDVEGAFRCNDINIMAGTMQVLNPVVIQGKDNVLCDSFVVGASGIVLLDMNGGSSQDWRQDASILYIEEFEVNGTFHGGALTSGSGWHAFSIGPNGVVTFQSFTSKILIDTVWIAGTLDVLNPVIIKGRQRSHSISFTETPEGDITLDSGHYEGSDLTNLTYSGLWADVIILDGQFTSHNLSISTTAFTVGGTVTFEPGMVEQIDILTVSSGGRLEVIRPVTFRGYASADGKTESITVDGFMKLDMFGNHDDKLWSSDIPSEFHLHDLTVNGELHAGYLSDGNGWDSLTVGEGGIMNFDPNGTWYIMESIIAGSVTSFRPFLQGDPLTGSRLVINTTGTLDLVFKGEPLDTGSGAPYSYLVFDIEIIVNGDFKAGSLNITTLELTIGSTGTMNVDGGGFLSDQGIGAGQSSSTNGGSGASYGGRGGQGCRSAVYCTPSTMPYGNIFKDTDIDWGSGGGSGSGLGGRGGGRIYLRLRDSFTMNGHISLNAEHAPSYSRGGGGSGGGLWVEVKQFQGRGTISCNGGDGDYYGGGGAGGRINIYYVTGDYHSGQITSKGGIGGRTYSEPGGPGITYLSGTQPFHRNLRIDNKCQNAHVTRPTGDRATEEHYDEYISTGAIAILLPLVEDYTYEFTDIEIYGGAELAFSANTTMVKTQYIYGDDTGYVHVAPYQTLEVNAVSPYKRVNVTYAPYIYENATFKLPSATVEFRPSFDWNEVTDVDSCHSDMLISAVDTIWGILDGSNAHLLIATGETFIMELPSRRELEFVGMTIQDGGILKLNSYTEIQDDRWHVRVNITVGVEYGSITEPTDFGSGGGSQGGIGGGILRLIVHTSLTIEGSITANGDTGDTYTGGGSGGSIWISTFELEGFGVIQANGGSGGLGGGGGSGGRIAIYWDSQKYWYGHLESYGGYGSYAIGGAGTVYMENIEEHVKNRSLIINNNNQSPVTPYVDDFDNYSSDSSRTWLPTSQQNYYFEEIQIFKEGHLVLHPDILRLNGLHVFTFIGDGTGWLHIGPDQYVVVGNSRDDDFEVNVHIHEEGELVLPPTFTCRQITIIVEGILSVHDLTVGDGCRLLLSPTGRSHLISDDAYTEITSGEYRMDSLIVKNNGEIAPVDWLDAGDRKIVLTVENFHIEGGGHVHAVDLGINVVTMVIDDLGRLVADYHDIPCNVSDGSGKKPTNDNLSGSSGAGHGGRGGRGSNQRLTGAPYGHLYEPDHLGCNGGGTFGGRGGGKMMITVSESLKIDGEISANGEDGQDSGSGGGSAGSIRINTTHLQGYGKVQVNGGNGHNGVSVQGGGGSAGRIAVYFSLNRTYSGSFEAYGGIPGGSGAGVGAPGTMFFYHTEYDHLSLIVDNHGNGPREDENAIESYHDLSEDESRAWILPSSADHMFSGDHNYHFDELQIYGHAHLAILTDPVDREASFHFRHMIGDRSGTIHIGNHQTMNLIRDNIDLPFNVRVYKGGFLGLAPDTYVHGVTIYLSGVLAHVRNLTLHHGGRFSLMKEGHTNDTTSSNYNFDVVHVQDQGYIHMIADPVVDPGISFTTRLFWIDGGGLVEGTHLYIRSENITIDAGGVLSANGHGYSINHGPAVFSNGTQNIGLHGVINIGLGYTSSDGSGAGHGGSGGHGKVVSMTGQPYGDIYEPEQFGSAGGGTAGGSGGGRIWFNVSNTLQIDGVVSVNGISGETNSGGGSGGSIWMHVYHLTGYGLISANGGDGIGDGGGGAGGRVALYFSDNSTFEEFSYEAHGGAPGDLACNECEGGGPGTVFMYHLVEDHRTLLLENNGWQPRRKSIDWDNLLEDGCRGWILTNSGSHRFANENHEYHFEELQIYQSAHLAILNPNDTTLYHSAQNSDIFLPRLPNLVTLFFRYMIGDRTGAVHVHNRQELDLEREEIDLPFSVHVYFDGHLGLAPTTFVHGVEIHMAGMLSYIRNLTLHHGGFLWLQHGGRTTGEPFSTYQFDYVRLQDEGFISAETDPILDPGITFITNGFIIEGGGIMHGTKMTILSENVTIDGGGRLAADGLGYQPHHNNATHGGDSLHGDVNIGQPNSDLGVGCGAGHGGSGGRGSHSNGVGGGFAYGDLYEPYVFGSAGGFSHDGEQGGTGGGIIWLNVTGVIDIDGEVTANGGHADAEGGGGGSGGSILMYASVIKGYGRIAVDGGDGSNNTDDPGGGGGGGRLAIYFVTNETSTGFNYHSRGGHSGNNKEAENGGGGTAFIYHMVYTHRTLIIGNGHLEPRNQHHIIENYNDLTSDGCRTWILPQSGHHFLASGTHDYTFEELQIYGAAHVAVLNPTHSKASLFFLHMIGDRSGTFHIGANQTMDLKIEHRDEIDLPFNVRVYSGGYLGLAPETFVHNVSIWLHGTLAHVDHITLHHDGLLALQYGGQTEFLKPNHFHFDRILIQDTASITGVQSPMENLEMTLTTRSVIIEGGGRFHVTRMMITTENITIDDGGTLNADGTGYRSTDVHITEVNTGKGHDSLLGSSGGGHGGTSGHGIGTELTGQPYGDLYEPQYLGSSGGGDKGGQGGGLVWVNVTNVAWIDGVISADGASAGNIHSGGGSGGSLWLYFLYFKGDGNITTNGGAQYMSGTGGAGSGGRIAVYFWDNTTYHGTFQSHGGYDEISDGEPGGPGTVFIYHMLHEHRTLLLENNNLISHHVDLIRNYSDISQDSFKAWILPQSKVHVFASGALDYQFEELQIHSNAHLAVLTEPYDAGVSIHFKHMIGDRSGYVHVGPNQIMDLKRDYIDTPFNSYVYHRGYLGLAHNTEISSVFVHMEGTLDHVHDMELLNGGELRLFLTGSTNKMQWLNYRFNGTVIVKAQSLINASSPFAHPEQYHLQTGKLIVEGGGKVYGKNLRIDSLFMTVDDGGHVSADDGGYLAGDGPGAGIKHKLGNSGASHGGMGGRGGCGPKTCILKRNVPYCGLLYPNCFGSGGAGSKAGIGGHTGKIQCVGGTGDLPKSGSGSGGRIAAYYSNNVTQGFYNGQFDVYGGRVEETAEAGAAGTAYLQHIGDGYSKLLVDNKGRYGYWDEMENVGRRLDLTNDDASYTGLATYTAANGITIVSSEAPDSSSYSIGYLFDQTLQDSPQQWFLSKPHYTTQTITLTVELHDVYHVNVIRIYPYCAYPTEFKVTGFLEDASFPVTTNYVQQSSSCVQGMYLDIPLRREADKFTIDLKGLYTETGFHTCYCRFFALTEVEFYVEQLEVHHRYKYRELDSAITWIESTPSGTNSYWFNETHILGGAQLAVMSMNSLTSLVDVYMGHLHGDKTGHIHVGYAQSFTVDVADADVPVNMRIYEEGHLTYHQRAFFKNVKMKSSGKVDGIKDLYVFDGGYVSFDSNSSLGIHSNIGEMQLSSLHVQDEGTFELISYDTDVAIVISLTNFTVYGGGHLKSNDKFEIIADHLAAVYSGGLVNLDGGGYKMPENKGPGGGYGSISGGSGGGHGGSGGRSAGNALVGLAYGSIYEPFEYGSVGGYGNHYGELYFGDEPFGNRVVRLGLGGSGGGALKITTRHMVLDGSITADGKAGGGSGGSVWIDCEDLDGYGLLSVNGGSGGGAAGRVAVYYQDNTKFNGTVTAFGGDGSYEIGAAGTIYLEQREQETKEILHRTLRVDNNGVGYPHAAVYNHGDLRNLLDGDYQDISQSGGITWLWHSSDAYQVDELHINGKSHVAILSNASINEVVVEGGRMYGDRTGVLHVGQRQTFGFDSVDIYIPINLQIYR
ncbi:uncharacterized protein LOC144342564 [Saccoglossus kowalevskii]